MSAPSTSIGASPNHSQPATPSQPGLAAVDAEITAYGTPLRGGVAVGIRLIKTDNPEEAKQKIQALFELYRQRNALTQSNIN